MPILGISPLDKDATACIYDEGEWRAVAEERLSRIKNHAGFPHRAVEYLADECGLRSGDIEAVVYPFREWQVEAARIGVGFLRNLAFTAGNPVPPAEKSRHLRNYYHWCKRAVREHRKFNLELQRCLKALGWRNKLVRVEHHTAHALGAFLTSGHPRALAVTLDWYGGGLAGSVSHCNDDRVTTLARFRYPHSLGLFYAQVTRALGFKVSRHEGKVVGLAAYGDGSKVAGRVLDRFEIRQGEFRLRCGMDWAFAEALLQEFSREDVAAGFQSALETVVARIVSHWVERTKTTNLVLSGGVAANVRMNQRVAALQGVEKVFVHPNMGDGGTGVGAVLSYLFDRRRTSSSQWETCFLGPEYAEADIRRILDARGLAGEPLPDIEAQIARRLADGGIVCRFDGRAEYGPRALGNRSILGPANEPAINKSLNDSLQRTEFMPFAPATLAEHCGARYTDHQAVDLASRFMTVTCDCGNGLVRESPAVVHVDGTARPQAVDRKHNPGLYKILNEYYRLTGIPTLINTSFNMHETPMVCSPEDALEAFAQSGLDYLAMGSFLISREQVAGGAPGGC